MSDLSFSAQGIRFAVVGVVVAAIYVVGYWLLLELGVSIPLANAASFSLAVLVQYVLQSTWTFQRPLMAEKQWMKFATLVGAGFIYSAILTSFVGPTFGWPGWVAATVCAVTLPVINYVTMRFWVYSNTKQGTPE